MSPQSPRHSIKDALFHLRQSFSRLTLGGEWIVSLSDGVKHNLRWFWFDGLFAAASDNILLTYLVLYLLSLGATRTQIGLMSSFSSLSGALLLLPGAFLVERIGHRKEITLLISGGMSRLVILILAFLPWFLGNESLIFVAIALTVMRDAFIYLAFPAWMSLTGDIIPLKIRGRYFGSRNFIMGVAGMITILIIGEVITRTEKPLGYQLAIIFAFILGLSSTYCFSRLKDIAGPEPAVEPPPLNPSTLFRDVKAHPAFLSLCASTFVWHFSINVAGPFFSVYMVENLKATATMVGISSILANLWRLLVQRKAGELSDRWGPRRVQQISMLLIPIVPALWAFSTAMWQIYLFEILSGIFWGAYNLSSFNFLLSLTPEDQRARYSALFQLTVTVALASGAAFGSWLITQWGYFGIFLFSAFGRLIAALYFARYVSPK